MSRLVPWLVLCVLFAVMCLVAPRFSRIFSGLFFPAAGLAYLATKNFPRSLPQMVRGWTDHVSRATRRAQPNPEKARESAG